LIVWSAVVRVTFALTAAGGVAVLLKGAVKSIPARRRADIELMTASR